MIVTLHRDTWQVVMPALDGQMPQVIDRITAALNATTGELVDVDGRVEGWRKVAELLEQTERTSVVGRVVRWMCCAAEAEIW